MKKVVIIPDSFKGTMSSKEICDVIEKVFIKNFPGINVKRIPVADGGEGSVDSFNFALGGKIMNLEVNGPKLEKIQAKYLILPVNDTAVIEMAQASGLPLVKGMPDPSVTSTFGVGELILDAIAHNAKNIILGLGGSSTNDCGVGCFKALGAKFFDKDGKEFLPVGGTLSKIKDIDITELQKNIEGITFTTMCDVDNPLLGINGASFVFAPQKGANAEMVARLNIEQEKFSEVVKRTIGFSDTTFKGAGAAGGMGYGVKAFLNSNIEKGIDVVLNAVNFDEEIKDADLVITGEGKFDSQSLRGKVVIGISNRTKKQNIPLIAIVGDISDSVNEAYKSGVTAMYSINREAKIYDEIKNRAKEDLALTTDAICKTIKAFER